jgi:hypothetical protein
MFTVRVFVNCKDPSSRTPIGDPTYVGSFAFFGHGHQPVAAGHAAHAPAMNNTGKVTFCFDLSETLRRLERAGQYQPSEDLKVTLVPVPIKKGISAVGDVRPGRVMVAGLK